MRDNHTSFTVFSFIVTTTTKIYTLSLHDALPIWEQSNPASSDRVPCFLLAPGQSRRSASRQDRKSTLMNSSHVSISYAIFCLKKKKIRSNTISFTVFPAIVRCTLQNFITTSQHTN